MCEKYENYELLEIIKNMPELNAEYAIEIIGGSEELYEMMLLRFVHALPEHIHHMDEAICAKEWDRFAITVHGIKGFLHQLGDMRLAKAGASLEAAAKANDSDYCLETYDDFKAGLICFLTKINNAVETAEAGMEIDAGYESAGNINDYTEVLSRLKAALEDYDSLLAADILAPLTRINFGDYIDDLLSKTKAALDLFQPQEALEYTVDILSNILC